MGSNYKTPTLSRGAVGRSLERLWMPSGLSSLHRNVKEVLYG